MNPGSLPNPYPAAGEVIDGKYQIEKVLGEGGMGCVARAFHVLLRAPVALKFMNPQFMTFPGAVERFINEGIASKKIKSEHVVPVEDVGKLPSGAPYLVMPCLDGMDLADLLARDGSPGLPTPRAVHFLLQILRGLQAAHAAGIIHRDMKPSNCFVVKHEGEGDWVKILDFGISKVAQPEGSASLTQTNSALGTPLYMSPEQAKSPRDVDTRSDLYSVGVILYELFTGHTPFSSDSGEFTEILFKLFTADPPPVRTTRPDLPDALAAAVHKALAREPKDRFATAAEMAEAIAPFADARSAHVIGRIRSFKASEVLSMPPPAHMPLPPSMVAFSALDARPATDVMANRPTTDVSKGAPVTALMANAPGQVVVHPSSAGSLAVAPEQAGARARPEDFNAQTQYDSGVGRPFVAGASTDLGASRDTSQPGLPGLPGAPVEKKRSPLVFGLPIAALAAIAGIALMVASRGSQSHKSDAVTNGGVVQPPPSAPSALVVTPPPLALSPSAIPSTAPAASSVAGTPRASASAPSSARAGAPAPTNPTPHPKPENDPTRALKKGAWE